MITTMFPNLSFGFANGLYSDQSMTENTLHQRRFVKMSDVVSEPTRWKWLYMLTSVREAKLITFEQLIAHRIHEPPNSVIHFDNGLISVHLSSVHNSKHVHNRNEYT